LQWIAKPISLYDSVVSLIPTPWRLSRASAYPSVKGAAEGRRRTVRKSIAVAAAIRRTNIEAMRPQGLFDTQQIVTSIRVLIVARDLCLAVGVPVDYSWKNITGTSHL